MQDWRRSSAIPHRDRASRRGSLTMWEHDYRCSDATWRCRADSTFLWSWAARQRLSPPTSEDSRGAGCRVATCCAFASTTRRAPASLRPGALDSAASSGTAAGHQRRAAGLVWAGSLREAVLQHVRRQRAVRPHRPAAEGRSRAAARAIGAGDGRHSAGRDSGAAGWTADYSVRRSADHRRLSQDRECDCGRHASRRPVAAARRGAIRRGDHCRSGPGATGAGASG